MLIDELLRKPRSVVEAKKIGVQKWCSIIVSIHKLCLLDQEELNFKWESSYENDDFQ